MVVTRLTGVYKIQNAPRKLKKIYNLILRLSDKLPRDSAYRKYTEEIICYRLSIVNQASCEAEIENLINNGRIEMLVAQAVAEYDLMQKFLIYKPWDPLVAHPPLHQWTWPPFVQ